MQLHSNPPAPTQKSQSPSPEVSHESFASQALTQLLSKAAEVGDFAIVEQLMAAKANIPQLDMVRAG